VSSLPEETGRDDEEEG